LFGFEVIGLGRENGDFSAIAFNIGNVDIG
jgi:hypothetical protein